MIRESASIATTLVESWLKGGKSLRRTIGLAIVFVGLAIAVVAIGRLVDLDKQLIEVVAASLGAISAILTFGVIGYQNVLDKTKAEQRIVEVEERFRENPKETQAAWELAQTELESYINRNLSQVKSIFWLTVLVMLFGFTLISYGIYQAFQHPESLGAPILTACSGIIVNFIGATFLVVFKSTMAQAQEYMGIIERINAVGMSVQILDTISDSNDELKDKTTSDIAQKLLDLYGTSQKRANK
ncbi:MAG: cytochrome c biogenesis protein CcdA [Marivirga sp.]|jgi:cytochrome c biogenesis protein CcdA